MYKTAQFSGWIPDHPDIRDHDYEIPTLKDRPAQVNLQGDFPQPYYQQDINSCTANAIAGAFQFELKKQGLPHFDPSRLFLYYNQRRIQNSIEYDSGASLRDGMYCINHQGVCSEDQWPYFTHEFAKKPFQSCYDNAKKHKVIRYLRLDQTTDQLMNCLAEGHPFVFGFSVYESFFSPAKPGVIGVPKPSEQRVAGHAVIAVGYNDDDQTFTCRNSWGNSWGVDGYFTIPYKYVQDKQLSGDFWTIRLVSSKPDAGVTQTQQNDRQ